MPCCGCWPRRSARPAARVVDRGALLTASGAPACSPRRSPGRGRRARRRLAQLVAVCDVYTWKLLRRDAGLSRRQTELALVELLEPLTGGTLMARVLAYTSPARGHLFPVAPILDELRAAATRSRCARSPRRSS